MITPVFDITDELPRGTTLLEASAGTGKTWTIASIVARAIASGRVRIGQVLLATFNRSAARELRARVHARLVDCRDLLAGDRRPVDELDELLAGCDDATRAAMAARLDRAVDSFEDATITTTHEFSARMLAQLGVLADHDPTSRLLADPSVMADQVGRDLFLRTHLDDDRPPSAGPWLRLGQEAAVSHPEVALGQAEATAGATARLAWARAVREESERRRRAAHQHTFDDLIADLAAALADPGRGPDAVAALTSQFRLVLVDEFQDTDPLQWQVLDRAFRGRVDLWLIGDPKQSIYAFRGADIHAYLDAVGAVDRVLALTVSRRADAPVVEGVSRIFGPALLGDPRIRLEPVSAWHRQSRISGPAIGSRRYDWSHPVQLRCIQQEGPSALNPDEADRLVEEDLVNQVVMMLEGGSMWADEDGDRALEPRDIAVLVRTRRRGAQIQRALAGAGVPAVFTGADSIWSSPAAADLADLLDGLEQPDPPVVARLALSPLGGGTPGGLMAPGSAIRPDLAVQLGSWARRWPDLGVHGVIDEALHRPGVLAGILAGRAGERYVTDLRQAGEIAGEAISTASPSAGRLGALRTPGRVADWIRDQRSAGADESPRRLETDRRAITIMTIHQAKGLGFPVVLLPDVARTWTPRDHGDPVIWHDGHRRLLDLGGQGPAREKVWSAHREDEMAEDLRTLYVAMTRARSALRLWWTPVRRQHSGSSLHRLLAFDHRAPATPGPGTGQIDPYRLTWLDGAVDVAPVPRQRPLRLASQGATTGSGAARTLSRAVDERWGRTSYSGLTAGIHGVSGPVDPEAGSDEPVDEDPPTPAPDPQAEEGLCAMPGGTAFGTLVHAVLERVRPVAEGLDSDVAEQTGLLMASTPLPGVSASQLAEGLAAVMRTDLGALTSGRRLCDIGTGNRLAELGFELSMASRSDRAATLADLAAALRDPGLVAPDDPLAGYGKVLAESAAAERTLAGFLTGSIDVVLRLPDGRHIVIDYKTNRIPVPPGRPLRPDDYDAEAMARMMIDSHYPLQAILYSAALHRMLASRLAGYDPSRHLGGVGYLFVRGMTGRRAPDSTMPTGVFTWYPSAELVVRVSDLLSESRRGRA